MRGGDLRTLLTLEKPSETIVSGEASVLWITQGTAWAKMESLGGADGELVGTALYRFTIRYRRDLVLTHLWRVGLSGDIRKFQLIEPPADPDGGRTMLVFRAKETVQT